MEILTKLSELIDFSNWKSTTLILGSSVVVTVITYLIKTFYYQKNYFKRLNLPAPTPLPIFGNFLNVIRNGLLQNDIEVMRKYGKTIGFYEGATPVIMTTDVKLIKAFCIKDVGSFVNRRVMLQEFNKSLV